MERDYLTTWYLPERENWTARCEMLALDLPRRARLTRLVRGRRRYRGLILDGSVGPSDLYVDLLAAVAIRRLPGGSQVPVVIGECQWKLGSSGVDRLSTHIGLRALDGPRTAYCVLSEWERERFADTWGVDEERVFVTPYCYTLSAEDLAAPTSSGGVFAGGNSLRNYEPLVKAAAQVEAPVTIATKVLDGRSLPENVTAEPVAEERYFELMREASVIVVPLADRDDRTAGQQTYLNAMALGKAVVVTDSPGVREYIEDGRTGIVVPPDDPNAMANALRRLLDPDNAQAVEEMSQAAEKTAREQFSPESYAGSLLAVADAVAGTSR